MAQYEELILFEIKLISSCCSIRPLMEQQDEMIYVFSALPHIVLLGELRKNIMKNLDCQKLTVMPVGSRRRLNIWKLGVVWHGIVWYGMVWHNASMA
jgi:hypothetical protein